MFKMMKIKRKNIEGEEEKEKKLDTDGSLMYTVDLQSNG